MKTPMQEILEGCGIEFEYKEDYASHYIHCGNKFANTGRILCPLCKKAKEERIKCIKEELEMWDNSNVRNISRISFLKSELKLGEDGK